MKKLFQKLFHIKVREKFVWIGDGFSSGEDQVGRAYDDGDIRGKVVSGTGLTITVEGYRIWRIK